MRASLLTAVAILAALITTTPAPAANTARFRATLSGAQFAHWRLSKTDAYCRTTSKGSGLSACASATRDR